MMLRYRQGISSAYVLKTMFNTNVDNEHALTDYFQLRVKDGK